MSSAGGDVGDAAGLQPSEHIRPNVGPAEAQTLASVLYGLPRTRVRQLNSYDDKNFLLQIPEEALATWEPPKNMGTAWEHGYVLKVLNTIDSKNPQRVAAQNEIMIYLGSKGLVCPQPVKNVFGQNYSIETIGTTNKNGAGSEDKQHIVRLFTYQPGEILYNVKCTAQLIYQTGTYVANMNVLLKNFDHPGLHNHEGVWKLESVPHLKKFIYAISDSTKQGLVTEVINAFENDVLPKLLSLERGVLHGDFNEQNILVKKSPIDSEWCIHGVIDWGDSYVSYYVFELAITICYMMLQSKLLDPLEAPGHVIAGYITKRKLPETEFQLLKKCISARLSESLVLGAYSYSLEPTNEYLLTTAATGWDILRKLWNTSEETLYKKWKDTMESYIK